MDGRKCTISCCDSRTALIGAGFDCVGRFTFDGSCDAKAKVVLVKHYLGKHKVLYKGQFDGEGTIFGRWSIWPFDSGEFMLTLVRDGATREEREIEEIVPVARVEQRMVGVERRVGRATRENIYAC